MADENKPAFYPRVGNIKAKNFVSAQPVPFIEDPRAMELPFEYGDEKPTRERLEMDRRLGVRLADLERQKSADTSPLEKLAGGLQAGRFLGSAMTQGINSIPTRLAYGDKAAEKFMEDRIYKPEQPLAYEYAQDVGDFLEKLETEYKIPPLMPEAVALQFLTGPALSQAMKATGKGAEQVGRKLESAMEPVVKGALERGGLPREMVLAMGANTQSNVVKPKGGNFLGGQTIMTPERGVNMLMTPKIAGETPAQRIPHHEALLNDATLNQDQLDRVKYQLEQTKGEAALDQWAKSNLLNYAKTELASPSDPIRLFIDKNYAGIEAKYAKDQERASRMAERAALEPDPRRKANLTRQAQTMRNEAKSEYDLGMDNISHLPREDLADVDLNEPYMLAQRKREGFPEQGMGVSDPAKRYEALADDAIKVSRAGDLQITSEIEPLIVQANQERNAVTDKINNAWTDFLRSKGMSDKDVTTLNNLPLSTKAENLGMAEELQAVQNNLAMMFEQNRSFDANAMRDNPFVSKLDPETKLYSGSTFPLGFDHVMDVLRQDVAEGRIRPEQLNKLSVEQAVRRTQEYNLERAKTMRDAKLIQQEGFTTYKDYPDQGYKWIELAVPEPLLPENYKILPDVTNFKNPGNELYSIFDGNGNVLSTGATEAEAKKLFKRKEREQQLADALKYEGDTMGHCVGGYCPDVISGKSKIYSLRDAKGEPHVTIEVVPNQHLDYNDWFNKQPEEIQNRIAQRRKEDKNHDIYEGPEYLAAREALPPKIKQIKGKQNAKPKDDYLPFVQDFVKNGKWSYVGDFKNTDLIRADDVRKAGWDMTGIDSPYLTKQEYDDLLLNELNKPKGMKRGGKVSISNNPDTMMLELSNQKMKNGVPAYGGAGAVIKQGLKAAKPEIMKASEALGKIEGRPLKITQADRTKVGGGYLGGPGFSGLQLTEPEYRAAEAAWAVQNAGTAKTILGGEGDNAVYAAMLGTPTQHQSNQMVFDKLLGDFKKAAKRGELTPELRDLINMRLAAAVDKKGNPVFPADVDIMDKKFRDIADTFSRRSIAGHLMGGVQVGGKKGQIIDYDKIIRSTTDPALIDQPTGALGNRLFTLSGGIIDRPDLHPAFPTILQGEDLGLTFSPVERNIVMKDFVDKTMREKGRMPGYMDYTRGNPPTQLITEDILTEMQKLGLKKGGAVKKAEGGEVTGDDLILEERPL